MDDSFSVYLQGGFCNRLFQAWSIYGLANKYNKNFYLNSSYSTPNPHSSNDYSRFYPCIPINSNIVRPSCIIHEPENSAYQYFEFDKPGLYVGYFQNHKYLDNIRDKMLEKIVPNEEEKKILDILLEFKLSNFVFLHVRMGDYVNHFLHYIDLTNYYKKAIELVRLLGYNIIIISDDLVKAKEIYPFLSNYTTLADIYQKKQEKYENEEDYSMLFADQDEIMTLLFMTQCKGAIGCNSSFSYIGAYLIKDPIIIIFPKVWSTNKQLQMTDFPENWTIMDC